jgi:putative colanic acid biosynthesis acetyltransferase WcaF
MNAMQSEDRPAAIGEGPLDTDRLSQSPLALTEGERWPYPGHEYPLRVLWVLVWATVWQLCWSRLARLRTIVLRLFGARCASVMHVAGSVRIARPWDFESGRCSIGPRTHLYNLGGLKIGEQVVISQDVYICGGTHDYTDPTYPLLRKKIVIGDYVWIAAGAFIGPGVTIGEGAVVGARAVVMKDVPPWTVVAGNPAVVVKIRVMKK